MIASWPLAASGSPSLFLLLAGVVVVVLLVGAFWYGSRRAAARKDPGARPSDQGPAARARQESWRTPDDVGTEPDPDRDPGPRP
ncbi:MULTISPECIES: DUF6479 family protein [unclassified Streptomyces]|uniref:DUF6479 family protein n=1 Tax=unclassified Streptomyces TaxID=2593676 RepID=UPI002E0DF2A5|nr:MULTISPECIES: DUF6479 family protein [unclassified Streptomyces]WSR23143.1 DUF6479 family protein [Streptomyces sp. NBC_01205]